MATAQQSFNLGRRRLGWFLVSAVFMFASAYAVCRWLGTIGTISGWIGLPQHEAQISRLRVEAGSWEILALTSSFFAAVFFLDWAAKTLQSKLIRSRIAGHKLT
jgi:TRAP-type mannitol/chloroaromatic compound transport system permease small subunit